MKNQILKSIVAVSFVMVFAVVSAYAQTNNQMVANIGFDFYVKNVKFAAGEYIVEKANVDSNSPIMIFRQKNGKKSSIVMLQPLSVDAGSGTTPPSLIFNRYGSEYFLSEVRNPADSFGAQVPKVKQERNLAKQLGEAKQETIALSSNQR